ncbi:MAG: hypothetical protein RLZ12_486 [Bacillota bacterium]
MSRYVDPWLLNTLYTSSLVPPGFPPPPPPPAPPAPPVPDWFVSFIEELPQMDREHRFFYVVGDYIIIPGIIVGFPSAASRVGQPFSLLPIASVLERRDLFPPNEIITGGVLPFRSEYATFSDGCIAFDTPLSDHRIIRFDKSWRMQKLEQLGRPTARTLDFPSIENINMSQAGKVLIVVGDAGVPLPIFTLRTPAGVEWFNTIAPAINRLLTQRYQGADLAREVLRLLTANDYFRRSRQPHEVITYQLNPPNNLPVFFFEPPSAYAARMKGLLREMPRRGGIADIVTTQELELGESNLAATQEWLIATEGINYGLVAPASMLREPRSAVATLYDPIVFRPICSLNKNYLGITTSIVDLRSPALAAAPPITPAVQQQLEQNVYALGNIFTWLFKITAGTKINVTALRRSADDTISYVVNLHSSMLTLLEYNEAFIAITSLSQIAPGLVIAGDLNIRPMALKALLRQHPYFMGNSCFVDTPEAERDKVTCDVIFSSHLLPANINRQPDFQGFATRIVTQDTSRRRWIVGDRGAAGGPAGPAPGRGGRGPGGPAPGRGGRGGIGGGRSGISTPYARGGRGGRF